MCAECKVDLNSDYRRTAHVNRKTLQIFAQVSGSRAIDSAQHVHVKRKTLQILAVVSGSRAIDSSPAPISQAEM